MSDQKSISDRILEVCQIPLLVVDADCKMVYLNPAMDQLVSQCGFEDDLDGFIERMKKQLSIYINGILDGLFAKYNNKIDLCDRELFVSLFCLDEDKKQVLLQVEDRTGIKQQERFRFTQIAELVHRLRSPLTAINISMNMLQESRGDLSEDEQNTLIRNARQETKRFIVLLNNLRDLLLIESGIMSSQINLDECNLRDIIDDAIGSLEAIIKEKGIELSYSPELFDHLVITDRMRLTQVVANILSNAMQFSPRGSTVGISCYDEEDHLRITVSDRGIGIPQKELAFIFDKFYRGSSPEVRMVPGDGIGLYISKHLLQILGGEIEVLSTWGKGTQVEIKLWT